MKFFFLLSFVLLLSCQTTSPKKNEISKVAHYQLRIVRGHLTHCMYPQALVEVKKTLSLHPDNYVINDKVGIVYFFLKQYEQAVSYFSKAIRLNDQYTEARVNLAHTLIRMKKYDQALSELKKAEADLTYSSPEEVYVSIGESYYFKKQYNQSQKYLRSSLDINSKSCQAFFYLGRIDFDQQRYDSALRYFKNLDKCLKITTQGQVCEDSMVDRYYFQGVSEIRNENRNKGVSLLNLFVKKAKSDNMLLSSAKRMLRKK